MSAVAGWSLVGAAGSATIHDRDGNANVFQAASAVSRNGPADQTSHGRVPLSLFEIFSSLGSCCIDEKTDGVDNERSSWLHDAAWLDAAWLARRTIARCENVGTYQVFRSGLDGTWRERMSRARIPHGADSQQEGFRRFSLGHGLLAMRGLCVPRRVSPWIRFAAQFGILVIMPRDEGLQGDEEDVFLDGLPPLS